MWLLGIRKRKPIIAPITDCVITSEKTTLEKLLTKGKAKIAVEGIVEINKRTNEAILKSWPPGKRFQTFLNQFSKELNDGMIGFTDLSVEETKIVFQVIRERSRDRIFDQFVEKLTEANKGFISFELIVVDSDQKVLTKSVDQMLLDTYKMFSNVNELMLNYEIDRVQETIWEYEALIKIRPIIANGVLKKMDTDYILEMIEKSTDVSIEIAKKIMNKYKIQKLLTIDADTSSLYNEKETIKKNLAEIDNYVLQQYEDLQK